MTKRKLEEINADELKEIKKLYLEGEKPKAIAEKFGLTASQVSEKARRENWKPKKAKINQKIDEKIEEKIANKIPNLVNSSLKVLETILNNKDAKDSDKINAVKAVLDISGLKINKQEVSGKDGEPIVKEIFITPEELKEVQEHVKSVIGE